MHLTKACIIGMVWAMSLLNSSLALAQTPSFSDDDKPRSLEKQPVFPKTSPLFKLSELYLGEGTAFDMTTTAQALGHPTTAYKADGSFLMHYYTVERGWAKCFGDRNTLAVVTANVAMNAGVDMFSRRLYARGGRWRIVAFGLNLAKASINTMDAVHNIRYGATVDERVRLETGYKGRILWSH